VNLRNGYPVLSLQYETNKSRLYNVHKVMMDTFKPENADTLPVINHINGIKTDDRLENLERCTVRHNTKHAYDVLGYKGLRGEECHLSKLTEIQVKEIDRLLHEGELTQYQIADRFSVKRHIISDICNGRAWAHLTGRVPTGKKYVGKSSLRNIGLKLTDGKILGIYNDAWHSELSLTEIGKKHGVGKHIVGSIKLGKTHSYVTGHVRGVKPTKSSDTTLDDFF